VIPHPVLETARLRLRPPRIEDAHAVFESYPRDPAVSTYMPWSAHESLAETEDYLRGRIAAEGEGHRRYWLVTCAADDAVLGMIGLKFVDHHAEVGFVLARAAWNHGYMTEALQPILEFALAQPGMYRVWGYCDVENRASARVMEKVGMEREGLLRRYARFAVSDEPRDVYMYAKTR